VSTSPGWIYANFDRILSLVQEATELAELFQKVDAVFASGNLQRISSLLGTMRRSLSMVGNVPEFHGGMEKLEVSARMRLAPDELESCTDDCLSETGQLRLCFMVTAPGGSFPLNPGAAAVCSTLRKAR
jgi:hypothetical protein